MSEGHNSVTVKAGFTEFRYIKGELTEMVGVEKGIAKWRRVMSTCLQAGLYQGQKIYNPVSMS